MSATVRIPTILRTYTAGAAEVTADGSTLQEVITSLDGQFRNYPELSGRLGDQKAHDAMNSGAPEVVACDLGCLMHIAGRAHRTGIPIRARHISEVLGS